MTALNRVVATVLWLVLLAALAVLAVIPLETISWVQLMLADLAVREPAAFAAMVDTAKASFTT
jgi:ribosomal protein L20